MTIKIENIPVLPKKNETGIWDFPGFIAALRDLKKGQSFTVPDAPSHFRLAITVLQHALEREFRTRKEGDVVRIGRVA